MERKVKVLTTSELQSLISSTIKLPIEDILALSSDEFIDSVEEARISYKESKVKSLEEIFE